MFGLNGNGYIISQNKNGVRYYQKKKAPSFVNKFGGGDSSYRDATFWQYFVQTNWRNGAKQLKFDDPGKFWKSSDVDTTILEELKLSKAFSSAGQVASGIKINALEAWRASASWWDANYAYRQQLTVTNSASATAIAGHPIKITIDTAALETATKVRSDRKDWRVVYFNGSAWVDLSRDYVSASVTFFALQASIGAGASDSNYYVYYGYASESTTKQPSTDAEWNAVYGMFGTTPDANSIAIYHMREGSGSSLNDDTTNSNNGTITGATWATDGKFGRVLRFTGGTTNNSVDLGSGSGFNLGSLTIEGWFKPSITGDQDHYFSRQVDGGASQEAYGFNYDGGNWNFKTSDGATEDSTLVSQTPPVIPNGEWTHVAVTYDGATKKVYMGGVEKASDSIAGAIAASTGSLKLGARYDLDSTGFFAGDMQHVRVSNIARTSFPYVLSAEPSVVAGTESTTQPSSSTFDLYAGGSDGKVYKWDGTTTWTEQFDVRRITWYETGTDANKVIGDTGGTETAQGQSFQVTGALTIKGLEVYLKKSTGTPGDITVRIETNSTDKPSGSLAHANATATIPAFTTSSYAWVNVEFATAFSLSSATTYWIVLKTGAASNDNYYHWAADDSSPTYSNGTMAASTDGGTTWSAVTGSDAYFRLKGNSTQVLSMLVSSLSSQKLYVGSGDPTGQTNGDARIHSFDGTNWALAKSFVTATESMVNSMTEYSAASKAYVGLGPQAKIYETSDWSTFTLSKDVNVPQNPGYVYAMKEYNRVLHAGGGSPELLPTQHYNGFLNTYDTTAWNILYPFDFTVIRSLEFYDAYLFMGTYHGHLYVYDTSTLNPLFNFKDQYAYRVSILSMKYFDDKLYIALYPQENSNETNVGIWIFDRRGLTLAHTVSGVTGYRCFAVVNGTLFVGTGDDGYVYKLEANTYKTSGWYQSSYFDANLPSIDKLYNAVTLRHDPLEEGQSITVYYRFKENDDWTTLGLSNTVGGIEKVLSFPTGTYSKKISLKVELATTNTSSSPKLTEVIMQYSLYPETKYQWTIRVKAKKDLRLLDNSFETRSAEEIRQSIEDLFETQQLYSYVDVDGSQHTVLMNDLDTQSWVINSGEAVNEEEVAITLLEA